MARITWTQRQDIGPSARFGASLAFDGDRSRTVLFGGQAADDLKGDTWEWDGTHWTQVQDSGPAARDAAAMAHGDAGTVLFGGEVKNAASLVRVGDTWSWGGDDWTQVADTGPTPRIRARLVFDAARSQYVLFGGSGSNMVFGDTWIFDGSEWTQAADTGPSPRFGHAMAYDAARERVVLFGGQNIGLANAETWTWDGADWTQVQNVGPSGRSGHVMAGTPSAVWLFGGTPDLDADGSGLVDDSWEWDGTDWTQRQDIGPSPRRDSAATVDSARERIVLFGGVAAGGPPAGATALVGDTWEARTEGGSNAGLQPDAFAVDASEAVIAGSELGYVTVVAAAPSASDRPISVSVGGVPETVASPPLRAGQPSAPALFRLGARAPGDLGIQVALGTAAMPATVRIVGGTPLRDFAIGPSAIARGGAAYLTLTPPVSNATQMLGIVSLAFGEILGDVQIPPFTPGTIHPGIVIGPNITRGVHRIVGILRGTAGISVGGPFEITVT